MKKSVKVTLIVAAATEPETAPCVVEVTLPSAATVIVTSSASAKPSGGLLVSRMT